MKKLVDSQSYKQQGFTTILLVTQKAFQQHTTLLKKVIGLHTLLLVAIFELVAQFYPWFHFLFILFLEMGMQDNEFERREN